VAGSARPVHQPMPWQDCVRLLLVFICLWMAPAGAEEQLEQETILIKGNQGLPRTLYIAPWKRVGAPLDSGTLEGEIGAEQEPLERDLFQRELELQRQGYSIDRPPATHASPGPTVGSGTTR
jgi:hypothetical protein